MSIRVLFDIVHPAHALFFVNPIRRLQREGAEILILSRHKDVTGALLDGFGFAHKPVSRAGAGLVRMGLELIGRDIAVLREARRFRPDVMTGFGGVAIAHVGRLLNRPAISFYDSENATLQTRLTWPFIDHLYVPDAYTGPVPAGRTTRFAGVKELSFLHPSRFTPDPDLARSNGCEPGVDNFLVRTVKWNANHDIGKTGWSTETLTTLVRFLAERGRVHISSERPLPADLQPYLYRGKPNEIHHLLAACRAYVGESTTMAREGALLGTPSIYDGADHPGATQELDRNGLLVGLYQPGTEGLMASVRDLLNEVSREEHHRRRDIYLQSRPDLVDFIVDRLYAHARH